jgi:hypothetical protein
MKTTDMTKREFGIAKSAAANYLATVRAGYSYRFVDGKWGWIDKDGKEVSAQIRWPVAA